MVFVLAADTELVLYARESCSQCPVLCVILRNVCACSVPVP